jgi:hypothetical protein
VDHVVWLPAAGLPEAALTDSTPPDGAPYPGGPESVRTASPTLRAQLGAGHGATVTLRRPQ